MPPAQLNRLNCTEVGRGPWGVAPDIANRCVLVRNMKNAFVHRVYYGTRTGRTLDDAEQLATALCAVLNTMKVKSF
jgi:hypothetical protein